MLRITILPRTFFHVWISLILSWFVIGPTGWMQEADPTTRHPLLSDRSSASAKSHTEDLLAWVQIQDYPHLKQWPHFNRSEKFWQADSFLPIRNELKHWGIEWVESIVLPLGIGDRALAELAQGEVVLLLTGNTDGACECTLLLRTSLVPTRIQQIMNETLDALLRDGATLSSNTNSEGWQCLQVLYREQPITLAWFAMPLEVQLPDISGADMKPILNSAQDKWVCISTSQQWVAHLIEKSRDEVDKWRTGQWSSSSIPQAEGSEQTLEKVNRPPLLETWIANTVNFDKSDSKHQHLVRWQLELSSLRSITKNLSNKAPIPDADYERNQNPRSSSSSMNAAPGPWEAIDSITGTFDLNESDNSAVGELHLKMSGSRDQGIFELLASSIGTPSSIDIGIDEICYGATTSWDMSRVLDRLARLYDRVTETPGAFEETLEATKSELGVDLKGEFFPNLGPSVGVFVLNDHNDSLSKVLFVLDIQNPGRNTDRLAKMLERLFAEDEETKRQFVGGFPEPLWRISLSLDSVQAAPVEAGLMIVGGQLWCSTQADTIVQALQLPFKSDSIDSKEMLSTRFQNLNAPRERSATAPFETPTQAEEQKADAPAESSALGYLNFDRLCRIAYQRLRLESMQWKNTAIADTETADLARKFIGTMLEIDGRLRSVDYSQLPAYPAEDSPFGEITFRLEPDREGWKIKYSWTVAAQ